MFMNDNLMEAIKSLEYGIERGSCILLRDEASALMEHIKNLESRVREADQEFMTLNGQLYSVNPCQKNPFLHT